MKFKTKKLASLLIIGLLLPIYFNNYFNFGSGQNKALNDLESSKGYNEFFIHIDGSIPGNWSATASAKSWCSGDGSWDNPYIIENVTIDCLGTGSGILINNSKNDYFIIRNCTILNANGAGLYPDFAGGIKLINSSKGIIFNNTCTNGGFNGAGLFLYNRCHNITIERNHFQINQRSGILIGDSSYNITVKNNIATQCYFYGIWLNNNINGTNIINNNFSDAGTFSIYLSNNCDNNKIINNNGSETSAFFLQQEGIQLTNDCDYNYIFNNTFNNNRDWGIYLDDHCDHNVILNNTACNMGESIEQNIGIYIYDNCNYNNVTGNIANGNTLSGIRVYYYSNYNNITGNVVNDNKQFGIYLFTYSNWNKIIGNTVEDNTLIGMYIRYNCDNNNIEKNMINRNDLGIALESSDYNNVSENTLYNNDWCIYEKDCVGNIIINNDCTSPMVQTPIFIDGLATGIGANNWTWAKSQPWCSGSGTEQDPYIIENLKMNGFTIDNGIEIWNSNVYFIIRNCIIYNSAEGIRFENVNNSRIIDNNFSNNDQGIYLEYSNNHVIFRNIFENNDNFAGLYVYEGDYINITGNYFNNNYEGIYLDTDCENNIIAENTINNNTDCGMYIYYECDNNIITKNIINNNEYDGIYLEDCDYNIISENEINNNDEKGIDFDLTCNNNVISHNIIYYNEYGIILGDDSNYNEVLDNVVNYNYQGIGIEEGSSFNLISNNIVNNNEYGMSLFLNCYNNTILENTITNNIYYGIELESGCENNTIIDNKIQNNGDSGIYFAESCDYNYFTENVLDNNNIGIELTSGSYNSFYLNFFRNNVKHAIDDGTNNQWNSTTIGNYWDNHTSPDTTPPYGIVDIQYNISGSAGSIDHFPIADDEEPSVTIDSPDHNDLFGKEAPTFSVTITDAYLFEMWYSFDGGFHNYTFTEFTGNIDQLVWDAISDGIITLTFYASDKPGNIGSAEVSIEKDATGPIIVINSPAPGSEFGVSAPAFLITVTDIHLDSIWYSLDGGLTNYTITTNTSINQAAWAVLSEGLITITFYANDTLGNLSFEEITITKEIPPGGLDPTIIIVIVVVSIVAGIVVIAGVYIFIKKRATPE
ncbi:MAG: right-handed parallel beta-helix repeat-containing protein [Promethearchaeota archaeon]